MSTKIKHKVSKRDLSNKEETKFGFHYFCDKPYFPIHTWLKSRVQAKSFNNPRFRFQEATALITPHKSSRDENENNL
jgi:hypothetical protein